MSISIEQQTLLDNLRAPVKSFRLFALEEVIRTGGNDEVLSVLEEINRTEDDPECSMLISHAISAVKEHLKGTKAKSTIASNTTAEDFLQSWKDADDNQKMAIISNLPMRLPKDIRKIGPELLEGSSPVVSARVVRTFGRSWPEHKLHLIAEKINTDSLVLKLAALRTIVQVKPEMLLSDLPKLLASNDPEIKGLAIRGLVKIDKEEALNHFQALLLSPMVNERLVGIRNCPFLPYELVKPLMLKYFAAETNYELLIKASWIIEMNPDIEVPFRLYEIAERSPAKKANLVKDVLNQTVRLLDKSGILGNKFSAYTLKLQEWVAKRNAVRYVKQVTARLDEETVIPELDKNIIVTIKQPLIRETFKEAMSWPISDLVKSRIANYLGIQTTAPETANQSQNQLSNQEQSKEVVKVEEQTNQQQIQAEESTKPKAKDNLNLYQLEMLASITPEKATEKLEQITLMISHKNTSSEIKTAALQCLTRCRLSGAEDVATRLIKNPDVSIATAAVEYLGIVNPDAIFPYLGQCLNVSDVRMKSAALGILKNYDYNQAISYLKTMLYSTTRSQQNMAMECINQFDFVLVRDMLTDFLCLDYPETLLEAGLCHFAANPSADNVYSLYKIEQAHKGKISELAKKLREECPEKTEDIATALTEEKTNTDNQEQNEEVDAKAIKEAKEAELKERLRLEKEKKASKKPAYAYKSASELPQRTSKEQLKIIWQSICDFVNSKALPISIGAFLIIAPTVYFTFIYTGSSPTQTKPKGKTLIANKKTIEGEVIQIGEESVTLKSPNGDVYVFNPRKDGYKFPEIGSLLRISIIPFREYNGQNFVKIRAMRAIDNYSEEFGGKK